jgi:hypothetical protein
MLYQADPEESLFFKINQQSTSGTLSNNSDKACLDVLQWMPFVICSASQPDIFPQDEPT